MPILWIPRKSKNSKLALILIFLLLVIALFWTFPKGINKAGAASELEVSAASVILIDADTGKILWQKDAQKKRPIASTTKIVTALLILEKMSLDETVEISKEAAATWPRQLYFAPGEKLTGEQLLYALLLESANVAAVALAEHLGGSVEQFVSMMNEKALELGAKDTRFANPHGLDAEGHYSTAYDLAIITRYILKNPNFAKIVSKKSEIIPGIGQSSRELENSNELLGRYPNATGVKTGYTKGAGYCLVASAKRGNLSLISVVLNAPLKEAAVTDSIKLLDFGFNNFEYKALIEEGASYHKLKVPFYGENLDLIAKKSLFALVAKNSDNLKETISLRREMRLPIKKGERFGYIKIVQNGEEMGKVELVASRSFKEPTFFQQLSVWFKEMFDGIKGIFRLQVGLG